MKRKKRIAILTSGGDCPGLNAVIRAVAKHAMLEHGMDVIGYHDGYEGFVTGSWSRISYGDVSGILTLGGTILGTSKKANPYRYAFRRGGELVYEDRSRAAIAAFRKLGCAGLIVIGGDGTMWVANRLFRDGIPLVGVPKTIDNDIQGTDITFGFDTAVQTAAEGIDKVHTTAQSHHRVMIVEVMGHKAGWLALHAGVASGGDIILIPEIPYRIERITAMVRERSRRGKRFSIIVVAEGARPRGGDVVVQRIVKESSDPIRLGGVGMVLGDQIEKLTGIETRTVVMGHLQRGGVPTPFDRVLATQLGTKAIELLERRMFGRMVAVREGRITSVALKSVATGSRIIPRAHPLIRSARYVGTCMGD